MKKGRGYTPGVFVRVAGKGLMGRGVCKSGKERTYRRRFSAKVLVFRKRAGKGLSRQIRKMETGNWKLGGGNGAEEDERRRAGTVLVAVITTDITAAMYMLSSIL